MKVAVTYDNGNVFGHFGRTEQFKVYDIEDGKVVSSQIMSMAKVIPADLESATNKTAA